MAWVCLLSLLSEEAEATRARRMTGRVVTPSAAAAGLDVVVERGSHQRGDQEGDLWYVERAWFGDVQVGDELGAWLEGCEGVSRKAPLGGHYVVSWAQGGRRRVCMSAQDGRHARYWFNARTPEELIAQEAVSGAYGAAQAKQQREARALVARLQGELAASLAGCGDVGEGAHVVLWQDGRRELFVRPPLLTAEGAARVDGAGEACAVKALSGLTGERFEGEPMVWRVTREEERWRFEGASAQLRAPFELHEFGGGFKEDEVGFLIFIYLYSRVLEGDAADRSMFGNEIFDVIHVSGSRREGDGPLAVPPRTILRDAGLRDPARERALVCLFDGLVGLRATRASREELAMCALRVDPAVALAELEAPARPTTLVLEREWRAMVRTLAKWDGREVEALLAAWRAEHPRGSAYELLYLLRMCTAEHGVCAAVPSALHAQAMLWFHAYWGMRAEVLALLYAAHWMTQDEPMKARLRREREVIEARFSDTERERLKRYVGPWRKKLSDAEAMEVKRERERRERGTHAAQQAARHIKAQAEVIGGAAQAARPAPRKPQAAPEPMGVRDALIAAVALAALALVALLVRSANRR